jgi:hypothetical protein
MLPLLLLLLSTLHYLMKKLCWRKKPAVTPALTAMHMPRTTLTLPCAAAATFDTTSTFTLSSSTSYNASSHGEFVVRINAITGLARPGGPGTAAAAAAAGKLAAGLGLGLAEGLWSAATMLPVVLAAGDGDGEGDGSGVGAASSCTVWLDRLAAAVHGKQQNMRITTGTEREETKCLNPSCNGKQV